jgi:hypothetical protein
MSIEIDPRALALAQATLAGFGDRVRSSKINAMSTGWGDDYGAALDVELDDGTRFRLRFDVRDPSRPGNH